MESLRKRTIKGEEKRRTPRHSRLYGRAAALISLLFLFSWSLLMVEQLAYADGSLTPPAFSRPIVSAFPDRAFVTCIQGQFEPTPASPSTFPPQPHYFFLHPSKNGEITIGVRAVSENPTSESGNITARLFEKNMLIDEVQVFHLSGSEFLSGDETVDYMTFYGITSKIYRLEVHRGTSSEAGKEEAPHYKLSFFGGWVEVGINSPSFKYLEQDSQLFHVNADDGENLRLQISVEDSATAGATQASSVAVDISDANGVLQSASSSVSANEPLVVAIDNVPGGTLSVDISADGHYMVDKQSGNDRGIYFDAIPSTTSLTPSPANGQFRHPVPLDIKPTSCPNPLNVKDQGVLPVAIVGTNIFNGTMVDVSTVLLEGVAPLRSSIEDVVTPFFPATGKDDALDCTTQGPDGILDLTLKFDAQEIVAALGTVTDGEVRVLTLTGNLLPQFGGLAFFGEDVIVIIKKK